MVGLACNSTIKISGTSTSMTSEACTLSGSGTTQRFTITNTAKRVIDPAVSITVDDSGLGTVSPSLYTINYAMGYGTFSGYEPNGDITITANYLPMKTVAQCRSASYDVNMQELDASVFDSSKTSQQLVMGMASASGSLEIIDAFITDYDGDTGGVQSLLSDFQNRTPKLLEIGIGGDTARFFVVFTGLSDSVSVKDLFARKLTWKGAAPRYGNAEMFGFSWQ